MEQLKDFKHIILIEEEELRTIISEELGKYLLRPEATSTVQNPKYVYGLKGIAELFNCSIVTANHIKGSGKISGAISQCGRIIITDVEKAIELFGKKSGGRMH